MTLLDTPRLTLAYLKDQSAQEVARYYLDNDLFLSATAAKKSPDFLTPDYWQTQIETSKNEFESGTAVRFVLRHKLSNTLIGVANMTQIFRGSFQAAYLGFSLCEAYQGQGLMKEALTAILHYAFHELNLHRIMANHLLENTRSEALLKSLGFVTEGIAKEYLYINGAWRDHKLTSLTQAGYVFQ